MQSIRTMSTGFRLSIAAVAVACLATACTDKEKKPKEPVVTAEQQPATTVTSPAAPPPPPPPPPDPCKVFEKFEGEPPLVLKGKGVVLTRMMKPCVTRDGRRGFDKNSSFLAMGVPCTGGSGRIDIKGHYHNPKLVSFIIGTDCLMNPSNTSEVHAMLAEAFGLTPDNKLLAYTPFVVQYWEVPGTSDADVGFSVDLRSGTATQGLWKQFRANAPVRAELYGRENAWVKGESFYHVTVDLVMTDRKSFRLDVVSVESLGPEKFNEVKARCEDLKPKRNCLEVF